jgi:hypothetical protein
VKKAEKEEQISARRQFRAAQRLQRLKDKQEIQISKTQKAQKERDLELIDIGEAIRVMEQPLQQISRSGRRVTKPLRFQS